MRIVYSLIMLFQTILDLVLILDDGEWWVGDARMAGVACASFVGNVIT